MTFLLTVNNKNDGFFVFKTKRITTINFWFVNFALYRGDLIHDMSEIKRKKGVRV